MIELYKVWSPTAREERRCLLCDKTILAGERYLSHKWVEDGAWWGYVGCHECEEILLEMAERGRVDREQDVFVEDLRSIIREYKRGEEADYETG